MSFLSCTARHDVAIDLGTASTMLYTEPSGSWLSEPSVVAVDCRTGQVRAVGNEACQVLDGRQARAMRPLTGGEITDLRLTAEMLRRLIGKLHDRRRLRLRMVASVPSAGSGVARRALASVCRAAGAHDTYLIDGPVAAGLGAGLPVAEPIGSMVLDIGAGKTEVAVIALGQVVTSRHIPIGGYHLDAAIHDHLKREHKLLISHPTAENIKLQIGSARPLRPAEAQVSIRGRDITTGRLKTVLLSSHDICPVLDKPLSVIIHAIIDTLESTTPELGCDITDAGITMAGGGSLLHGLAERVRHETSIQARLATAPQKCLALGSAHALHALPQAKRSRPRGPRPQLRIAG